MLAWEASGSEVEIGALGVGIRDWRLVACLQRWVDTKVTLAFEDAQVIPPFSREETYHGHISDISGTYLRHIKDISVKYLKKILDISLTYLCLIWGIS